MRTTDRMNFSVKEIVAMGKEKGVGKDEWLHAVAEVYGEKTQATCIKAVLKIDRSCPFHPTELIGKEWTIDEQDERSLAISELDLAKVELVFTLKNNERYVEGEEKLRRLKALGHIRLDAKVFWTIWENKHLIPESWKSKYVYFDGTIFQDPSGDRCVLYLCWVGGEWRWRCDWLGLGWRVGNPSAVLAE